MLPETGIPYAVLDARGRTTAWNDSAFDEFGELIQNDIRDIVLVRATTEEESKFLEKMNGAEKSFTFDFAFEGRSGDPRVFRLVMNRLDGAGFIAIFLDIGEFRQRERDLAEARDSAEKASISRSQFLANISHEIRTPIQTIIGMMELLDDTKLDEEQTEYVRQVKFSADVMLSLVNDILDLSKVEAGQLKIERIEFDLPYVIERTVDLVSMEAHKKGLEICIDIAPDVPGIVVGDPNRIQQVILNLVKNAVKFTARGHVLVTARKTGDSIHFDVADTGIGVKPEIQHRLFTQFFQGDASTTRKYGGTGLGLAISRNIVELMTGSIGVKNNEPTGADFWFEIPLPAADRQPPKESISLASETRFLVVDDNQMTLSLLRAMLASMGFADVTLASSGTESLEALRLAQNEKRPYDVVFIDMIMPEMDGWRLAAEINKNRDINQAQLYLMVPEGSFGADAKMKLLEWFNGYLYKPIKRRKLAELLNEHKQASIDLEIVEELESPDADDTAQNGESDTARVRDQAAAREGGESETGRKTPAVAAAEDALPGTGLTALVAEDHPVNRRLMKTFLERAGAAVIEAEDGQEATELIARNAVDLVFMDIQMPRLNGYEATAWMRERGYNLPIIACTASAQENERERSLGYGMTDILPKPYKRNEIIETLRKYGKKAERPDPEQTPAPASAVESRVPAEPQEPIFDANELFEIMMGDVEAAKSLVGEYLSQTAAHLDVLRDHVSGGRLEDASKTAHLIKGSSLNVTARRLAAAALVVEKDAQTLAPEALALALRNVDAEFGELRETLDKEGYIA